MRTNNLIAMGFGFLVLAIPQLLPDSLSGPASVGFDALAWTTAILLAGGVLGARAPRSAHLCLLSAVLFWLCFGAGWTETGAVVLWLASAWSLGVLLLRALRVDAQASGTQAVLLGAAIWLALWGGMLHFAINYRTLHLVLCLLPCLLLASRPATLSKDLRARAAVAQDWMRSIPLWAWIAGLALIGWVLRWASFPTVTYDDHAQHLRIWTDLLAQQRVVFDVHTQIWSVAPFATDLLHAGLSLMAGDDARSAMNLGLTLLLLLLMACILQRWQLPAWVQWLLIVLLASTPMLGNLLISLQTELLLAVLALAGLRLVMDAQGGWRGTHVLGVLACAALCTAVKLPGAVLGVTLLAALALRWWHLRAGAVWSGPRLRWPALLLLLPLGFVALHSYALALKLTGNPLFPLYNAVFLSPFALPYNFSDTRWIHGFSLHSYVRAFFETSRFFESGDYTAGWQYLLMLPLALLALWRRSIPVAMRLALMPLLGFGLVMFSATQYWRYLFPVMPIAGLLLAALFFTRNPAWRILFSALALLCIGLNMAFFPRISWIMETPAHVAYKPAGKARLERLYAPAAVLTAEVNRLAPGTRVLYSADTPAGATLHGTPLYVNWYAPFRELRFNAIRDAQTAAEFFAEENIEFAILNRATMDPPGAPATLVREYLARYGVALTQAGSYVLYRVKDAPTIYRSAFDLHRAQRQSPGTPQLLLPASPAGVEATPLPQILATFPTQRGAHARYSARLRCASDNGSFVAQINWDVGTPYYRLVACSTKDFSFVEALPVPMGARQAQLYLTVRDTASAQVQDLLVEID